MASDRKHISNTPVRINITLSVSIHTTTLVETRPVVVSLYFSSVLIHAKLVETRPDLHFILSHTKLSKIYNINEGVSFNSLSGLSSHTNV